MKPLSLLMLLVSALLAPLAVADDYSDTLEIFRRADQSGALIDSAYGYALLPLIGKGGFGVGGAYGEGRVYRGGAHVGDVSMAQLTLGWQLGAQAYSQMIVFQDQRAFDEFTSGNFEFGAQATAVAITAGVSAEASTRGTGAGVSGGQNDARTVTQWYHGMAVFTIAKGGLMYEASVGGQKFSYTPR